MLLICLPTSSVTASRWLSSCYSRKLQTRLLWLTCCHHCLVLSGQTKTDEAEGLGGVETPAVSCVSQQGLRMQQKSRSYIQSYSQPVNVQPQTGTDAVFLPGNDTVPLFHLCAHHWVWTGDLSRISVLFYMIPFCVHKSITFGQKPKHDTLIHTGIIEYPEQVEQASVSSQSPGSLFN